MHFNAYGGNGAALSAALVNATDFRPRPLARLIAAHEMLRTDLTAEQAGQVRAWAAQLAPVFGERDTAKQVELVNGLLEISASRPYVSTHDGLRPHLHFCSPEADIVARVRDTTAGGLAMVVCFSDGRRLGRCEREGCEVVFVDTSRNGRRRFCSLTCANRVNVAAHRARAVARRSPIG
ncbi:CGNR zinc finger domain-containing protein [Thermoactinospora rubra]|uniref:CGNR zinc finger domain-containing protein n=1 Tax=Thermoactinospora rubra TaxID=1088767 RepID=UPI000A0FA1BB|nr:CGNR zinc finger domain-containing protein [Thermoactinospora rubra]